MKHFIRSCRIAAFVSWMGGFIIALGFLATNTRVGTPTSQGRTILAFALWWIYPALILLFLHFRTGLTWHLLNAHPTWHALHLMVLIVHIFYAFGLREQNLIVGVIGLAFLLSLERLTNANARKQRNQAGDRWEALGDTSPLDILTFQVLS